MHHTTFCFFDASWHNASCTSSPCSLQDLWRSRGCSVVHCLLLFRLQRRMEDTEWWGLEHVVMDEEVYVTWIIFISKLNCQRAFFFLYCSGYVISQDEGLRIAWQYKKYFGDEKASSAEHKGGPSLPVLMFCFILLFSCWLFYAVHIEPPVLFKISWHGYLENILKMERVSIGKQAEHFWLFAFVINSLMLILAQLMKTTQVKILIKANI